MTKIQVPDHVAKSIEADLKKEKQTIVETPTEDGGPTIQEEETSTEENS